MSTFEIGQEVRVKSPGHRKDGQTGTISYYSKFMSGWGVMIDGEDYGFWPNELEASK